MSAQKQIALFGGSFNPPGLHHREIARMLGEHFDEVLIVPCGPRPDKQSTNDIPSVHRAAMVDLAFKDITKTRVELFDLELESFTRTVDLEERFSGEGTLWHVIGTDLIQGGRSGESAIQKTWKDGPRLWATGHFAVITRPGYALDEKDLPPHHRLFRCELDGSSAEIRNRLYRFESAKQLLSEPIAQYIQRYSLYRSANLVGKVGTRLTKPQIELIVDERNAEAVKLAKNFPKHTKSNGDVIVVIGGDGTMLRAIRHHWRRRVPLYGINAGHTGFLLNSPRSSSKSLSDRDLVLYHQPLLFVETETIGGERVESLAFNDAWVERATGQSAWISVSLNGKQRFERLIADGILVATASGSAAYARAMGAAPIPFNTPVLLLVGSNVFNPNDWKFAVLPMDSQVEIRTLDPKKRPLNGFSDGEPLGEVRSMRIRLSRSAAVELAFDPEFDPGEKLAHIQFPEI